MKLASCLVALATAVAAEESPSWVGGLGTIHTIADNCIETTAAAAIAVSSNSIPHLSTLNVTFSVESPTPNDRITAYCASSVNSTVDSDYMDFQPTKGAASATLTFGPLVNMRCDYQFRYQKETSPKTFVTVATSPVVTMTAGVTEPLQVHIALTGKTDEMRVMWTSGAVVGPRVRYSIARDNCGDGDLDKTVTATSSSYAASDMCGAPASTMSAQRFIPVGTLYDAVLKGLPPSAKVQYQVGSDVGGWSDVFAFTMPDIMSPKPSSFFVFGDMGTWTTATGGLGLDGRSLSTAKRVADDMATGQYAAALHIGDLSYADSVGYIWEQFMALVQPIAATLPYMVSVGNHEYAYTSSVQAVDVSGETKCFFASPEMAKASSGGECGVPTARRYHMPSNGNGVFWYSFDLGLAHHVVVSSEHDFNAGSRMRTWLEADLAAVNRAATPWVFLHVHRPMYVSIDTKNDQAYNKLSQAAYEPVLAKFGVDAVFTGHVHNYERTCPVLGGVCKVDGDGKALAPTHIMVGTAGKLLDEGANVEYAWSVAKKHEYGYGRMHLLNASHAYFEFVRDVDGVVSDDVWLVSDHKWAA
ncbi:hypothetical protein SPRG_04979 [Saprolegnia parasitica CBS 223.65]|uniref:Purple acid phosphatase n=1 Tax=Saprolegnia parasitica (strain CBS 223.65) TaxID=695850 RepID=A0A067CHC5_SAPPC|nr:hypothetical protein SPRG_04979 [Saprolegnia parasitica CBS 223.65]KDO29913.1 hypothetical protein SPRG_04979 [Saprolegnia parasitica CBS 223.65]|eukprot:XP_012199507.1 hypothetical protein SPRG_04979 [Saprolegnia parasitica CBS 223.65]